MAFSVKQTKAKLQEYGVPAEQLDTAAEYFCSAHKTDLDAIKEERDTLKTEVETLTTAKKELDGLKAEIAKNQGKNPFEVKYNAIKEEYEAYKAEQAAKESKAAKSAAYRQLLKDAGISEKRLDAVLRVSDVDSVELEKDGKIKGADKLMESVKAEWSDFITTTTTQGANTPNPPANTNAKTYKTKDEIYAIKDTAERQRAILDNHELFGI